MQSDPPDSLSPTIGDPGRLERRIDRALFELLFARTRVSNLAAFPVGVIVCWMLWNVVDRELLLAWAAAKWLVAGVRLLIAWRQRRDGADGVLRWGPIYEAAMALDGVVYGLIGTLLVPPHLPEVAALLEATTIGIAAVGLIALSSRLRTCLAFCAPVLLPPIVMQVLQGTRLSQYTALAMAIFLALIFSEGRRAAAATRETLRLRFEMDDLATQRQQALDLAQRHSAVKSQFLATMSHEMRTPLHGMLGLAALARGDAGQAPRYLGVLEHTGRHLLGLINDVLDYSKIERGYLKLDPAPFDLAELLATVAELTRASAAEKGLQFRLDADLPAPCWVHGDAARLRQVLLNLSGNAVKFTDHGRVTLRAHRAVDGATRFEVVDTGPGIPAQEREQLFEPFQQGDASFGRRHGGTGLGLAISRELARAMGGDVRCTEVPGASGSAFSLELPLPAVAAPLPTPPDAAAPPVLRGRLLLVEDNPVNAMVAEAMLVQAGLEVETVADGAEALQRCQAVRYDLVLMDCQMPGMDGFEATRRIRAAERDTGHPPVPIVALTANALEGDRQRSLDAGMDDHLAKPFDEAGLRAVLARHLAG